MYKTYCFMGKPQALARPRLGTNGVVYNSQRKLMNSLSFDLKRQHGYAPLYTGPIELNVIFFMALPANKKVANEYMKQKYHIKKPDNSNLTKFVEDVAIGVLYEDDCIIARIFATKMYDYNPRTEFKIIPLVDERTIDQHTDEDCACIRCILKGENGECTCEECEDE
jgi:Holliday junction resolvase RusA-like endonuclease